MKKRLIYVFLFVSLILQGRGLTDLDEILSYYKAYEFEEARSLISQLDNSAIKDELYTLADLLFFAGQQDSTLYSIHSPENKDDVTLSILKGLNKGYFALFYHKTKGEAFKYFYKALKRSRASRNKALQRASLLGILEYYHLEIALGSEDQERYLNSYKVISVDINDEFWATFYGLIFGSKTSAEKVDPEYYILAENLNILEEKLPEESKLLPGLYFEKGVVHMIKNDQEMAKKYFAKAIASAKDYPFAHYVRFLSFIDLSRLADNEKKPELALQYVNRAKSHIDLADTLRSNYYIKLYSSYYHGQLEEFELAYNLLRKANNAEHNLDYRKNSLEINRLNVVLETQQKELANFKLRQNAIWLIIALSVAFVLLVISYLGYKNIRSKKRIVENEKEIQIQKVEKLLKEQELASIDAMIVGQEKERKRIASDLHDNLGSLLTAIKMHFQSIKKRPLVSHNGSEAILDTTDELIEEAYQKVRGIAHARNAGVPAHKGLLPAVKNFTSKVSIPHQLNISVADYGMEERLDNSLEITLFRIIQELITNIIKHAKATEACVHLTHHEDSINVMVEDNGKGMNTSHIGSSKGMGLYSIQKRIDNLDGTLAIDSVKGRGTNIIIDIPVS